MKLIRKDVVNLTIPIVMEQTFVILLGMINTMMAGHINDEAVSATGMVDTINYIFISFFTSLAVGGTVVVAQFIGRGNVKKANQSMKQALYSGILLASIITIVTWILRDPLISVMYGSASPLIKKDVRIYLSVTLLTYPLIAVDLIANGILRGAGDTKTPMKITIFMNFVNVIFSYIFIYGININNALIKINFEGMGILGAALGIAVARTVGAVVIFIVLLRGSKIIQLRKLFSFKFDKELLRPIFSIGIPASMESIFFNGGKLITQVFIVNAGTSAIAANTIANSITNLLNVPGNSLSTAATALVGRYMGKEDTDEAEKCLDYILKLSTASLALVAILCQPFAGALSSFYTSDKTVISLSTILLRYNGLFMPVWSLAFVLPAGLKGAGDAKYTMVTSMIGMWLFRITVGYILGVTLHFGVIGVWFGMFIDWVVRGILYFVRFKKGKWKEFRVIKSVSESA